jgi:Tfp pilus assembly protein PilN
MIRINLLGQPRPKVRRAAVPAGAALPVILGVVSLVLAGGVVMWEIARLKGQIAEQQTRKDQLTTEKNRLTVVQQEVLQFEQQKLALEQQKAVIDELQRNRTGGQELLQVVADTVTRTEQLWLTSLTRRGPALSLDGTAASINAVANFITELRRSGYFDKIEIKESRQDDRDTAVTTFLFSLTADFVLPQAQAPAGQAGGAGRPAAPGKS